MDIRVCRGCGRRLEADEAGIGRRLACPGSWTTRVAPLTFLFVTFWWVGLLPSVGWITWSHG